MDTSAGNPTAGIVISDTPHSNCESDGLQVANAHTTKDGLQVTTVHQAMHSIYEESDGLQTVTAHTHEASGTSNYTIPDFDAEHQLRPIGYGKEDRLGKSKIQIRRTHLVLLMMLAVVIVALVGGLAGGLAGKHRESSDTGMLGAQSVISSTTAPTSALTSSPPTTTTPTPTPVTSGVTGMAALPCPYDPSTPFLDNTTKTSFAVVCYTDIGAGQIATNNYHVHDFSRFVSYTLADCLEKCAVTPMCAAAVYGANLTQMVAQQGGNCILKNATVAQRIGSFAWMVSAVKVA